MNGKKIEKKPVKKPGKVNECVTPPSEPKKKTVTPPSQTKPNPPPKK
jgi:hypothetical protein